MWEHLRGVFVLSTLRGYGLIRSGVILLAFLPFSLWIAPAAAFVPCELEEEIPKTRPPSADGQPTEIHVKFFLLDLVDVITVKQEFMVDLFYSATWKDSRVGALLRKAGIQSCEMALDQIWRPSMIALNDRASTTNLPQIFTVSDNGRVVSQQRLMGSFGTHFDLSEFPLDTQVLPITFVSTKYSLEELKVVLDASDSMERFTETGWTVEGTVANSSKFDLGVVQAQSQPHGLVRFDYKIQVKRQTIYYVWKVFLPLCMIVMVSWAVFWIHPSQLGIQTGIGTGMMLSLIAFLFSLQNILPKINYLTRMDLFVYSSLTFVFLAFIEAITSGRMAAQGKEQLALRIDLVSRFIFPCAFLGVVLWFWRIL
jgi:hypothetical protein